MTQVVGQFVVSVDTSGLQRGTGEPMRALS